MKVKITVAIFFLSFFGLAQNRINYKALIKDASGNILANQGVGVQFIIYQGAALTNNVYQESHITTTDANGLLITNIGEGSTADVFADVNWSNDDHFLNVQVNIGSGLIDLGTTQFMAVPYALSSKDNPWDKNEGDIYTSSTEVGIGTSNPEHTLDIRSNSLSEPAGLNLSNSDKSRNLRFFSGSETFPDPSITRAPGTSLSFATFDDNTLDFDEHMRISSMGDVGIGKNDPEARLDIRGGDWNLDAGNPGDLRLGNDSHSFRIGIAIGGGGAGITRMYTDTNDLILGTNSSPSLVLDHNGAITAPSVTNSLINTSGNKALITKEYFSNNIPPTVVGPIAYGSVNAGGSINNGSGNFSVFWDNNLKRYVIDITGENYDISTNLTIVTPFNAIIKSIHTGSAANNLLITAYNDTGEKVQTSFNFISY